MLISNYIVEDLVFRCAFVSMNAGEREYLFDVVVLVFVCGAVKIHSHAFGYPCSVALVVVDGCAAATIQLN